MNCEEPLVGYGGSHVDVRVVGARLQPMNMISGLYVAQVRLPGVAGGERGSPALWSGAAALQALLRDHGASRFLVGQVGIVLVDPRPQETIRHMTYLSATAPLLRPCRDHHHCLRPLLSLTVNALPCVAGGARLQDHHVRHTGRQHPRAPLLREARLRGPGEPCEASFGASYCVL
jgi:hypothetical protein